MRAYRLIMFGFLAVSAVVGLLLVVQQHFVSPAVQTIKPEDVHSYGGHAYYAALKLQPKTPLFFRIRHDGNSHPVDSNAIVFEDGKFLGPPHSQHLPITQLGGGRYSHWGSSAIVFSASDNTDPRTNGRKYEIVARPVLPSFMAILVPILILLLLRLLIPRFDMTIGLAAVTLAVWTSFFFGRVGLSIDTATYIAWSPAVPLGYPLFLSGVKQAFGALGWAGVVQMLLMVAACTAVAFSVERLLAMRMMAFAVLLLLLCEVIIFWQQGWLMSEALYIPLILVNLAAAFFLIAELRARYALLLALSAALIMFVRPAGNFVVLGIVFLLIARRVQIRWLLKWACLPFVVFTLGAFLVNASVRGSSAPSQMGNLLFTYVAFLFEPQFIAGKNQDYAAAVGKALEPDRARYDKLTGGAARSSYSANNYNARFGLMDRALSGQCTLRAAEARSGASEAACSFENRERVYLEFFFATIQNRPLGYLELVSVELVEAWRKAILERYNDFRISYDSKEDLRIRTEQIEPLKLPITAEEMRMKPELLDAFPGQFVEVFEAAYGFIRTQRWLIYLIGFVTLIAIPIAMFFRSASTFWLALGYCGVLIHGAMLLTASVTVFIPRYAWPIDPIILVAGAIMVGGLLTSGSARLRELRTKMSLTGYRNPSAGASERGDNS